MVVVGAAPALRAEVAGVDVPVEEVPRTGRQVRVRHGALPDVIGILFARGATGPTASTAPGVERP